MWKPELSYRPNSSMDLLSHIPCAFLIRFLLNARGHREKGKVTNWTFSSAYRWPWRLTLVFILCLILPMLIIDLMDLVQEGPTRQPSYGKVRDIVNQVAYSSSQMMLGKACITLMFFLIKSEEVIECVKRTSQDLAGFPVKTADKRSLVRTSWGMVAACGLICALMAGSFIINPSITANAYIHYGPLWIPGRFAYLALLIFIDLSIIILFLYSVLLHFILSLCCTAGMTIGQRLQYMWDHDGPTDTKIFGPKMEQLLADYMTLLGMQRRLQQTFNGKMVADLVTNTLEIMIVVSWLCIWFVFPEIDNGTIFARFVVVGGSAVVRMWMLVTAPCQLHKMPYEYAIMLENVMVLRQCAPRADDPEGKQANACVGVECSAEELESCYELLSRLKHSSLTFCPGEFISLTGNVVLTASFLVFGYFCFVVDEIENNVPECKSSMFGNTSCMAACVA